MAYNNNDVVTKGDLINVLKKLGTFNYVDMSSYWKKGDAITGAVWNDYAEFRTSADMEPGRCVIEVGDDTLTRSTDRLQPGAQIISDTYGMAIGQSDTASAPVAVTGRVLAYPFENISEFKPGLPVCSGPNGTISIMTEQEARDYPWCIVGTVSAIPNYTEWGPKDKRIKVNGRIWIKVK